MSSSAVELREHYLRYFERGGHTRVKSSPLVPANDPTLMFTNAGMVQFKDVFVGAEKRPYKRAATCQKCMRVSGKHNDLEEVGRTARHHTLFEMLGNFSFGDYFKEEAISLAWGLLRELGLDERRLWVTVFGGEAAVPEDAEARRLWRSISGLPDARILNKGMKDNFWAMGDTGPCGPCTEIHYDTDPKGDPSPKDFDSGRIVEIWNNVFMQFERQATGELVPLPAPCVDTGMGLERLLAVVNGERSNYHTDLFLPLLERTSALAAKSYTRSASEDDVSMRVIADHARATAFLVADGIQPSNEGRGYVLRRIMRRAIRHGNRLGIQELFFQQICDAVVEGMSSAYPELVEARALIGKVAELEELGFRRTLATGLTMLDEAIAALPVASSRVLDGTIVFRLYDTFGFPKDLTELIATERGLSVDEAGFSACMEAQRQRSRTGAVGDLAVEDVYKKVLADSGPVTFNGYTHEDEPLSARAGNWRLSDLGGTQYITCEASVRALIQDGALVLATTDGVVEVVLEPTPFYGEAGGQVGDQGVIVSADGSLKLEVISTQKPIDGLTVARARLLTGKISKGDTVWAGYVPHLRKQTRAHHSATHLLHRSLRKILGTHVTQAGSLVDPEHLRFDFTHFESMSRAQLLAIESDVNAKVQEDATMCTDVLSFDEAKAKGAMALFGEKYADVVRMVTMGGSVELCGGTHIRRTKDIGMMLVLREEAVASGVRRIEAAVADAAERRARLLAQKLLEAARILNGAQASMPEDPVLLSVRKAALDHAGAAVDLAAFTVPTPIPESFARGMRDCWWELTRLVNAKASELAQISDQAAASDRGGLLRAYAEAVATARERAKSQAQERSADTLQAARAWVAACETVGETRLVAQELAPAGSMDLRTVADQVRSILGSGVICLTQVTEGRVALLVSVSDDLTGRFHAGKLVQDLAPHIGGRGGGKDRMAQAGGTKPEGVTQVFVAVRARLASSDH